MDKNIQASNQSYMFQDGANHPAVKVIKTFLNSSPKTPIVNLKTDKLFDSETKRSLASFQKNKGLNPTGAMNIKTWLAIGAEMDPIQINLVSITDRTLRDLLQMGYRSNFPFKKINSKNPLGISGSVKTKSSINETPANNDFTFTVYVTAFAPFNWFGPLNLSRGDGNDRRFGYKLSETYRLRAESKMTASPGSHTFPWSVTKSATATDSYLLVPSSRPTGIVGFSLPSVKLATAKSEGTISDEETGDEKPDGLYRDGNSVSYHFYGNDDAFALWGDDSLTTSDIDIHTNILFEYEWQSDPKKVLMKATGKITGDQFPAVETYILDRIGNGVMLGAWQVREGDGPVFTREGGLGIIGDKKLPMIDIDVSVIVENGFFTGVQKFGRIISLAEHNKQFTDLPPVKPTGFRKNFLPSLYPSPILMP